MNKEAILAVADAIEGSTIPDLAFNMNYFYVPMRDVSDPIDELVEAAHGCGTVACIAGWACAVFGETFDPRFDRARDILGLTAEQGEQLFFADGALDGLQDIPKADAVAVLRHLAETGEVVWPATPKEPT